MVKNYNRGFTLIELLVVIAIIGILSSVVLAALNSARDKGGNATIKSDINNIRAQAEFFYEDPAGGNGTYNGICSSAAATAAKFIAGFTAAHSASGASGGIQTGGGTGQNINTTNCHAANGSGWAVSVPLKTPEKVGGTTYLYFCADSSGFAGLKVAALPANNYTCP